MDVYIMNIILSWVKLFVVIIGTSLALFLLIKGFKYLRAIMKRSSFMRKLKDACNEEGVKLEVLSSPYSSVFKPSSTSELLLEKNGELYTVKFFPCINPKDTYQFDADGNYHTISNFKPILMQWRYP